MSDRVQIDVGVCRCREKKRLAALVAGFAEAMLDKLEEQIEEEYTGWDNVDGDFDEERIVQRLTEHLPIVPERNADDCRVFVNANSGWDPVDVANFAAFAWHQMSGRPRKKAKR